MGNWRNGRQCVIATGTSPSLVRFATKAGISKAAGCSMSTYVAHCAHMGTVYGIRSATKALRSVFFEMFAPFPRRCTNRKLDVGMQAPVLFWNYMSSFHANLNGHPIVGMQSIPTTSSADGGKYRKDQCWSEEHKAMY